MTINAAGRRSWSPKGRPKIEARNNGYSHAEGGVATSYPAFGAFGGRMKALLTSTLLFAVGLIAPQISVAQVTQAGTVVRNTGSVAFEVAPGDSRTVVSNEVTLVVAPSPSRATIGIARYEASSGSSSTAGPTQCLASSGFVALPVPVPPGGQPLDPMQPIPMQATGVAHAGEPIFVRVADADRNRDAALIETVDV